MIRTFTLIGSSSFTRMQTDANGGLHKDVVVVDYIRLWNADEKTTGMRRGIPKSHDNGLSLSKQIEFFHFKCVSTIF